MEHITSVFFEHSCIVLMCFYSSKDKTNRAHIYNKKIIDNNILL